MPRWSLLACALLLALSTSLQAANGNSVRFDIAVQSLAPELISPNGDGVLDSASAQVEFFCRSAALAAPGQSKEKDAIDRVYKVNWTLQLVPDSGAAAIYGPSGSHILSPESDAEWRNGLRSLAEIAWSGEDEAGQPLPSGGYTLELAATFLRETTVRLNSKQPPKLQTLIVASSEATLGSIEIDITPPSLSLAAPADGLLTNQSSLMVRGTATDAHLESFSINGAIAALDEGSFNQAVSLSEGSNTITVEARDVAGNSTTVTRTVSLDTVSPVIADISPADGAWTLDLSALISASVTDAHELAVAINGQAASLVDGRYQVEASLTTEGEIPFQIRAEDAAGNVATATITINRDVTPPALTIAVPTNNALTNNPALTVSGSASDLNLASVAVNGTDVSQISGPFSRALTLVEGDNVVHVRAVDKAGNETIAQKLVTLDTAPPQIAQVSPADGSWTRMDSCLVAAIITDQHDLSVTVNNEAAALVAGQHQLDLQLTNEGTIPIEIRAEDAAGNEATAQVTIYRDVTPPVIALATPVEGHLTNDVNLAVSGTIVEANLDTLQVDGSAVTPSNQAFSASVVLQEEENSVLIQAIDRAGNQASLQRQVILDTIAPVISAVQPGDGVWTAENAIEVSVAVSDVHTVNVTVNGSPATFSDGRYRLDLSLAAEGSNPVELCATDAAGNVSTSSLTIHRDTTPPVISLSSPAEGLLTNDPTLAIAGSVDEANLASLTLNGEPVQLAGQTLASSSTLQEGENTLLLVAEDRAGNETRLERVVTLDTEPPVISSVLPENETWTAGDLLEVSASVADAHSLTVSINGEIAALTAGRYAREVALTTEGTIAITVRAEDGAGNIATATISIQRDVTPPTLTLVPADGSALTTSTPSLSASFDDSGAGIDAGSFWALLDGEEVTGSFLVGSGSAQWSLGSDNALDEGEHALTIQIRDQLGNLAVQTVHFTTPATEAPWDDGHAPLICDLQLSREYFCPGENPYAPPDHRKVFLTFSLTEPSDVALAVYQPNGTILRLENLGRLAVGEHTTEWDGRAPDGRLMVDGTYELGLSPVDALGNVGNEARATVVLFY